MTRLRFALRFTGEWDSPVCPLLGPSPLAGEVAREGRRGEQIERSPSPNPSREGRGAAAARSGGGLEGEACLPLQRAQALIEAAVTIPILILLFLGFLAIGLVAQALVDLNTAVYLAAVSAVTAPAGNSQLGGQYAADTFNGSMHHVPELSPQGQVNCGGTWNPPARVTCTASAQLLLSRTPLGIVVPVDPVISATATANGSPYRST